MGILLSILTSSLVGFAAQITPPKPDRPVDPTCAAHLATQSCAAVGRAYRDGALDGADVIGLIPLSRQNFGLLMATGRVEAERGFQVNPILNHPRVADLMEDHPEYGLDVHEGYDQRNVSAIDAWVASSTDLIRERITTAGGRIPSDEEQFTNFVYALRPADPSPGTFTSSVAQLARAAESLDLDVDRPSIVDVKFDRGLSRRLSFGADREDLLRWSRVRAVAELFNLPWHDGPFTSSPDRRLVAEFFGELPTEAGVVVAIDSRAFKRIAWNDEDSPRIYHLTVDDLVGIESRGEVERGILSKLSPPP